MRGHGNERLVGSLLALELSDAGVKPADLGLKDERPGGVTVWRVRCVLHRYVHFPVRRGDAHPCPYLSESEALPIAAGAGAAALLGFIRLWP